MKPSESTTEPSSSAPLPKVGAGVSPMHDLESRLAALREYEIMDTPPEQSFDDLTRLTTFICDTPIALVTLLDLRRQWFKSTVGLSVSETPLEHAFCAHAIKQEGIFLVPDATQDKRFSSNPLVTGDPHIRFYAGAPLVTPNGVALGTLCAIDRVPREFSQEQQAALAALARQVVWALELRKTVKALSIALAENQAAQHEITTLQELLPMCAWCRKLRNGDSVWRGAEDYLAARPNVHFTHGICPECNAKLRKEMDLTTP